MPSESSKNIAPSGGWRSWTSSSSITFSLAALLTWGVGWIGLSTIHRMSTTSLEARLNSEVDTCVFALQMWLDEQRMVAQSWAGDAGVRADTIDFLNSAVNRNGNKDEILKNDELLSLRNRLRPVCEAHRYVGFVIVDPQGRQVATLLDEALGKSLEPEPLETILETFRGKSVATLPFVSSISLPNEQGVMESQQTTMFAAAPIQDDGGTVVAALAFRLRTSDRFAKSLETARPGESGETYAFDKLGLLLSDSRFNDELRKLGLISSGPSSHAALELELRDPGGDLVSGYRPSVPRASLPLTRMAENAVAGRNGIDVGGYRDYRGKMVVGAWRWMPTYEFGVAREVDFDEAYESYIVIRRLLYGCLALFAAALLASIVLHHRRLYADRLRARTQESLVTLTNRFQAVLDSATQVSIIATDMAGQITVFNTGAERMLQYGATEMVGCQSPAVIHLESEVREHGDSLSCQFNRSIQGFDVFVEYARQGKFEEREWTYVRKDGSHLTVNLVVTALRNAEGIMTGFLGIAKDVTASKRAEVALRHERFLLQTLMENLPDSIYFKDTSGRFLRVSRGLAKRFKLSDPQAAVGKTDFDFFTAEHARQSLADEQELIKSQEPVIDKEERETWPDGRRTWVATSKFPLRNENGHVVGTFGISRDITERKLADERFRLVVESSLNALLMTDQDGKIVLLNSQAEKLFGYPREEMLGLPIEQLVPSAFSTSNRMIRATNENILDEQGVRVGRDLQAVRKDGSLVEVEIGFSPLETEDGMFALASVIDITTRKSLENSLRAAKGAAEANSRAKSDFLANMSHEIRTPMNAIIGMTELVLGSELVASQREYLTMVLESGESLLAIINEILDFSKIEAGKMKLELVDFDIWDVVGDAAKSLALRAHSKGLELAYHIDHAIPAMLVGDPVRLRQVIVNLVGNSIKFTEQGEIVVDVSCVDRNENGLLLCFAVTDTGIGIPTEKQKLIFDAFTQADSSTTRRFGGTGLGLAISSRLVSLFGGTLELQSEVGKGSTFSFTIWLGKSTQVPVSRMPLRPDFLQGTQALIVDDNATNRRIVQEMVISWGMVPIIASSGSEALQELESSANSIAIVLTDMHMPEMDGLMLVEQIRRNPLFQYLPVVVLSSGDQGGGSEQWEAFGVAIRLMKPVKQSDLLTAIENSMSSGKRVAEQVLEKTKDDLPPIPSLRILLAEDGLTNQKLAVALLKKWGHAVTVANDGREAVHFYETEPFDLILMDVQMPDMDGLEATACIRTLELKLERHIPIIAMTARAMKGDREQCLQSGMDGYVSKPVRQRELYLAIASYFAS